MTQSRRGVTLLACLTVLACSVPSRAALDPELNQPYRLRVVLGIAEHRLLTKVFRERVERELRDGLQAALGDVAVVEVVRDHPRLKAVERNGLGSLGAWTDVDGVKTHFVLIDYVNGEYEIQSRQHDGLTGLASPVVRRERLPDADRQLVARTAALMVGEDFGPVATVIEKQGDDAVTVALKASSLAGQPGHAVKKGDVFWLVRMWQGAGGMRGEKVPWALLQVQKDPEHGVCPCAVYNRHPRPLAESAGVLGYRCLGLSTITAPVRIQLVQVGASLGTTPVDNQQVYVRHQGFTGEDNTKIQGTTDSDGYFSTEKAGEHGLFHNMAFVSVVSGNKPLVPKIPVELVDEHTTVIPVSITADANQQLVVRRDLWVSQIYESLLALAGLFKDLEGMLKDKQSQKALERAQAGADGVREDLGRFDQQRQGLVADAHGARVELTEGDERLKELREGQKKLDEFVAKLKDRLKEENDPRRREAQDKIARAQLLEDDADYGKALELYKEVLDSGVDVPQVRERYEKLKQEWEPKSDEDRQARAFIYDAWPKAEPLELKAYLTRAEQAYRTCHQAKDVLTLRKLLKVAVEHAGRLKKLYDTLQPDANTEDRDKAQLIAEAAEGLNRLIKEATADVEKVAPAPAK